ncbi:MAG: hypothetical protein ABI726_05465 [bacterium]
MAMEPPQPPRSGADPESSADRLRDRVAEAKASISQGLREVVDGLEREQEYERRRSSDRIDAMVSERLATAERELGIRFDVGVDRARAELEQGLAARVHELVAGATESLWRANEESTRRLIEQREQALRAELEERSKGALGAIEGAQGKVTNRLEEAAEKLSRKARRHDSKMARLESSRRVESALAKLEERGEEIQVEAATMASRHREGLGASAQSTLTEIESRAAALDADWGDRLQAANSILAQRTTDATARVGEAVSAVDAGEQRIQAALSRLEEGVGRVDRALAEVTASERQIAAAQVRVGEAEARFAEGAVLAADGSELEVRIQRATAASDEAVKRIAEAEERLRAAIAPNGLGPEPGA